MSKIKFSINEKQYELDYKFGPDVSLNEYIRTVAELRGTKAMCREGGCGACIVSVRAAFPPDNVLKTLAVNSCLVSVLSCHGWEVTTVEGIGNRIKGYHEIQSRLAQFNGTQCGYCTPGWVMNMYSLYESKNGILTSEEIENSFASNMCRCTGYRPIADAFKSFAKDADQTLLDKLCDLEDLDIIKPCGLECVQNCTHRDKCFKQNAVKDNGTEEDADEDDNGFIHINDEDRMMMVEAQTHQWYRASNLGVYHITGYPTHVIDIFNVAELKGYTIDVNLILGAGMPLSEMMELFLQLSEEKEEFSYLKQFYDHMDLVAHIPVRNVGTIGGNLFLKYTHNDFQSDVFLLFETVGAMVTIAEDINSEVNLKLPEFLKTRMSGKIIKNIMLPPLSIYSSVKTFKIEGALIMGLGYWTAEKVVYDGSTGKLLTNRTWNYKIPGIKDIPSDMRIYFCRNSKNEFGVLHSKATGEPSVCLATVLLHAAREEVRSARLDASYEDKWLDIDIPCTMENIFMAVGHKLEHFKLK